MCAPARGEPTCFRCAVTDRRAPSVSLPPRRSRPHRSRFCRARRSRKKRRPGRSSRGTRPPVLADGPEPPYRVRWTLPAPTGDALSGAVSRRRPGRLGRKRGRLRDRRGLGRHRVAGGSGRGTAVDAGDRSRPTGADPRLPRRARSERCRRSPGGSPSPSAPPRSGSPSTTRPSPSPAEPDEQPEVSTLVAVSSRIGPSSGEHRWERPRGAGSRSTERTRSWATEAGPCTPSPWRAARSRGPRIWTGTSIRRSRSPTDRWSRSPGTPTRGRSSSRRSTRRPGSARGQRWRSRRTPRPAPRPQPAAVPCTSVRRTGARGARWEGRLRTMGDTGALAVLPGDLARVRRRERVRGGHRRWPVPARRRRWWAQVELPSERGRTAELARRLRLLAPTRAQRRSPVALDVASGHLVGEPRPRGWSGRSRCRAIRSSR